MTSIDIRHGDCLEVLRSLSDNSVDSVVTDPPYGLSNTKPAQVADVLAAWVTGDTEAVPAKKGGFMGKDWDSFVPPPAVWAECLRVLKPGGHMAVFAGARTQDLMGLSIRLAGFEIRDTLGWIYGSGFPKSQNVSKAIDKAVGAKREKVRTRITPKTTAGKGFSNEQDERPRMTEARRRGFHEHDSATPASDEAAKWDGWGTALKPAIEPIILARKPLDGTVAANVLEHGVGGLNIDACRVPTDDDTSRPPGKIGGNTTWDLSSRSEPSKSHAAGRFPANVLLDEHAAEEMDKQSGNFSGVVSGMKQTGGKVTFTVGDTPSKKQFTPSSQHVKDYGGASRFFPVFKYQAKAPKKERPVVEREDGTKIQHPTVKPLSLMSWIVTLTTPEGGTVLDPFAGTGTTLQAARDKGFAAIGVEQDADYIALIEQRLSA